MTKFYIFIPIFLLFGCTAQYRCATRIDIINSCSNPIKIEIENFTNLENITHKSLTTEPSQRVNIGFFIGLNCRLDDSVFENYKITISTNKQTTILDKYEVTNKISIDQNSSSKDTKIWIFDPKELCQ